VADFREVGLAAIDWFDRLEKCGLGVKDSQGANKQFDGR
jgi:hypothetical protein